MTHPLATSGHLGNRLHSTDILMSAQVCFGDGLRHLTLFPGSLPNNSNIDEMQGVTGGPFASI